MVQPKSHSTPLAPMDSAEHSDTRLEKLYDYTKWHIGIYLSTAGGLATLIGSVAEGKASEFLISLVGSPIFVGLALLFMVLAGAAGGIVASSVVTSKTFDDFWYNPQGPSWWKNGPAGSKWVAVEHLFFWISLVCLLVTLLLRRTTLAWLGRLTV